jgi:hypothetical protein
MTDLLDSGSKVTRFASRYGHRYTIVLTGLAIGGLGVILLNSTRAAGPFVSAEPEQGTITTPAAQITDATASASKAVKFAPAGAFQANCIVKPSDCGYPDATNTGVPPGTVLTEGPRVRTTITQNGAVIQNLNVVDGTFIVHANNVTIKKVRITTCDYYPIEVDDGFTGTVIEDTEIHGTCTDSASGISFGNFTARRVHVWGTSDGFKADANSVIEDSYIHDLGVTADSHNDGVQSLGGDNVTLRHNTIDIRAAGVCIQLGNINRNWQILNNLFNCTGWQINGGNDTDYAIITGQFGDPGPASIEGVGITWTGNYYDDNGEAITSH